MKTKANVCKHIFTICALFFCMFVLSPAVVQAAEATSTISVDRAAGKSTYTLKGLEPDKTSSFSRIVERKSDSKEVLKKEISDTDKLCQRNIHRRDLTGSIEQ
ncbi:MAG: hypothetical protein V8R67_01855 [Eubacterium sp.]